MQILGNTKTFFDTQSYRIVDTNVNEYLNKTIEDEYGILFNMAQDQTMNDMVNSQCPEINIRRREPLTGGKIFGVSSLALGATRWCCMDRFYFLSGLSGYEGKDYSVY